MHNFKNLDFLNMITTKAYYAVSVHRNVRILICLLLL